MLIFASFMDYVGPFAMRTYIDEGFVPQLIMQVLGRVVRMASCSHNLCRLLRVKRPGTETEAIRTKSSPQN